MDPNFFITSCLKNRIPTCQNEKESSSSQLSNFSSRLESLDYYNDIPSYKNAVNEIKKVRNALNKEAKDEFDECDEEDADSTVFKKFSLLRPDSLISEKSLLLKEELEDVRPCSSEPKLPNHPSVNTMKFRCKKHSNSFERFNSARPSALKKFTVESSIRSEYDKLILIAEPGVIKFHNCELHKTYKKLLVVQNVDTQMARFRIEIRPAKSAFELFIESPWGTDKDNIAPGMHLRFIIRYKCVDASEPEELLLLYPKHGRTVQVELKATRDPPVLKALVQASSTRPCANIVESDTSSSGLNSTVNSFESPRNSRSPVTTTLNLSYRSTFDCKRCFVGEFVIVSTLLKNKGGKGRFFVMSEMDWCSMNIEDITTSNMLIALPFAIWPAYFVLENDDQLTMYTYFFPDSYGLQTVELYIVADNYSLNTIEVIGDGVVLEPTSLQFDKNIKYQWFKTKRTSFCTIRYLDLGVGTCNGILARTFTIASKCDLDVYYRWEISDVLLCIAELKNTVGRKNFDLEKFVIEPRTGLFYTNSNATFKVVANLYDVPPGYYRLTLQLVIEDVPYAAVMNKEHFTVEESKTNRRLCDRPVDVYFENIEVRIKCAEILSQEDNYRIVRPEDLMGEGPNTMSFADLTNITDSAYLMSDNLSDCSDSSSEILCRFVQGYGNCNCCQAEFVSTAILRPDKTLHVGIESEFVVLLRNNSSKRLKYWWGEVLGCDHTKVRIKIEPNFDIVMPGSFQEVKLRILPLESGVISSIFISCQFNGIRPVVLSLECTIEALKVSFYFAGYQNSLVKIEWLALDFISQFIKKTGEIKLIKKKLKDETFLHTLELNSSDSLDKKTISSHESPEGEEMIDLGLSSFIEATDLINNSFSSFESWKLGEGEYNEGQNSKLLPYVDFNAELIKKLFRYLPLVLEFHVTPEKSETKRIYIVNESPIGSKYQIKTKNDRSETAFKDFSGSEEELEPGVMMTIEPMKGGLKPFETIVINITARSNTWGVYTDEVAVKIDLLPDYLFWVRIINDKLPIFYPVCRNSTNKIPKLRFKIFKPGCSSQTRRVLIENTSVIPLYIHWHCFSIEEEEDDDKPFQLLFDMLTPFIDIEEFLAANAHLLEAIRRFFSCAFNPYESKELLTEINEYSKINQFNDSSDYSSGQRNKIVIEEGASSKNKSSCKSTTKTSNNNTTVSSSLKMPSKNMNKEKDTEFQLTIVPYFGKVLHDVFIITPQELFLPPKEKRYIDIHVNADKLHSNFDKILCKAFGFIRIPPIFKYRDNVFFRKDGYYLPPTEIHLECDLKKPCLKLLSGKRQRTFEFYAKEFNLNQVNEISIGKKLAFKNTEDEILNVTFEIGKPLSIKHVITQRQIFYCGKSGFVCPDDTIEIDVQCLLSATDFGWMKKTAFRKNSQSDVIDEIEKFNSVTVKRCLVIHFEEGFKQTVETYVKLCFSSLKLSTYHLDFGVVDVGDTKSLTFKIENLLDRTHDYVIEINEVQVFTVFPRQAFLTTKKNPETSFLEVTANFTPINPGHFRDTLNVISKIEGLVARCILEGRTHNTRRLSTE